MNAHTARRVLAAAMAIGLALISIACNGPNAAY